MARHAGTDGGRLRPRGHWCTEAERVGLPSDSENAFMLTVTLRMWIDVYAGDPVGPLERWNEFMRRWPEYLAMTRPPIAITLWHAGRLDDARAMLDQVRLGDVTEAAFGAEWLSCLAMLGDVAGRLGDHPLALPLYQELLPHRRRFAIDGIGGH